MIAIVDYNMGNLASVKNAFAKLGKDTVVENNPEKFKDYDKLILPGVGAFGDAMEHLKERNMVEPIKEFAASGKPMIGICLGMQLLFESSEEFGKHEGLGLIKGSVTAFDSSKFSEPLKVPHMGWNEVAQMTDHPLWKDIEDGSRFYFVHSYYVEAQARDLVAGVCRYGKQFDVALARDNAFAVQFHPEKSSKAGLQLLKNFLNWDGKI